MVSLYFLSQYASSLLYSFTFGPHPQELKCNYPSCCDVDFVACIDGSPVLPRQSFRFGSSNSPYECNHLYEEAEEDTLRRPYPQLSSSAALCRVAKQIEIRKRHHDDTINIGIKELWRSTQVWKICLTKQAFPLKILLCFEQLAP